MKQAKVAFPTADGGPAAFTHPSTQARLPDPHLHLGTAHANTLAQVASFIQAAMSHFVVPHSHSDLHAAAAHAPVTASSSVFGQFLGSGGTELWPVHAFSAASQCSWPHAWQAGAVGSLMHLTAQFLSAHCATCPKHIAQPVEMLSSVAMHLAVLSTPKKLAFAHFTAPHENALVEYFFTSSALHVLAVGIVAASSSAFRVGDDD